jgi:COP9 signalosome complex subunit 2
MRAVYSISQSFSGVIEDPRVIGIIKESGGKMYMSEKRWELACDAFFASFCKLVECGAQNAVTVLKYVLLSSLLAESSVDYLSTQEARVFA